MTTPIQMRPIETIQAGAAPNIPQASFWNWIFSFVSQEPQPLSAELVIAPNLENFKTTFVRDRKQAFSLLPRMGSQEKLDAYKWLINQNIGVSDIETFESDVELKKEIYRSIAFHCGLLRDCDIAAFAEAWGLSRDEKIHLFKTLMDLDQMGHARALGETMRDIPGIEKTLANIETSISLLKERISFRIQVLTLCKTDPKKTIPSIVDTVLNAKVDTSKSWKEKWIIEKRKALARPLSPEEKDAYIQTVLTSELSEIAESMERIALNTSERKCGRSESIEREIRSLQQLQKDDSALIVKMEEGRKKASLRR